MHYEAGIGSGFMAWYGTVMAGIGSRLELGQRMAPGRVLAICDSLFAEYRVLPAAGVELWSTNTTMSMQSNVFLCNVKTLSVFCTL